MSTGSGLRAEMEGVTAPKVTGFQLSLCTGHAFVDSEYLTLISPPREKETRATAEARGSRSS